MQYGMISSEPRLGARHDSIATIHGASRVPTNQLTKSVKRGPESQNYIYVIKGFVLTIEAALVTMIDVIQFRMRRLFDRT
jgi:hypothetical protein